jgi:hypothetical protein
VQTLCPGELQDWVRCPLRRQSQMIRWCLVLIGPE